MSGGTVRIERSGAVAWLTLQRPEALNAFSKGLVSDLRAALAELRGEPALARPGAHRRGRQGVLRGGRPQGAAGDDRSTRPARSWVS